MATKNKANEIHITRIYDAPVKIVWDAWIDPKQVAQWWGPRGFKITTKSKDVRPGGTWVYTMHGPDGVDWPNTTVYHEVERYSRLVYDHGGNETQPPLFRVTVNFSEITVKKTKMDMTMAMNSAEELERSKKMIKSANGNSTWDRLAEFLSDEIDKKDVFVINRSFEAPINLVFEMFTDPKHFSQWLAPTGFSMKHLRAEIKPGGTSFYQMNGPQIEMYGKINYKEVIKPARIVYTQIFCDENETITRHPKVPTWPETMLTTIQFETEENNSTRVTIRWEIQGAATDLERETFRKEKPGMTQGWTGSFDKLEEYLTKHNK